VQRLINKKKTINKYLKKIKLCKKKGKPTDNHQSQKEPQNWMKLKYRQIQIGLYSLRTKIFDLLQKISGSKTVLNKHLWKKSVLIKKKIK